MQRISMAEVKHININGNKKAIEEIKEYSVGVFID